ncbi:MAG: hypothetical protein GTO53_01545 [Planctomycetales bacterium]|nr:hypothetical protein [Planctomycetales bacterium]NIM07856.1 hypothetical protein [Planctomycetales bacterium]NIN07345.1 hypothetical protein [Planctomycetales bacterium]NIN76448.1 hypothetical protein [Planctomycetales bacterium]NIO35389.1 hypothetical protein [Planctomycetales bacterium]
MSESQFTCPADSTSETNFVDRRSYAPGFDVPLRERRQFCNSHEDLSPEAQELARAIDQYKLVHRRRFITYEEMLSVIKSLGYHL